LKIHTAKNGVKVRSLGESTIADEIIDAGLFFRYEPCMKFGPEEKCPDFLIKCPHTTAETVLEFFGALHIENYEISMYNKMNLFERNGYIQFIDLLYIFSHHIREPLKLKKLIEDVVKKNWL